MAKYEPGWALLGRVVQRRRERLGVTQEAVAAQGGPSTATLRNIENVAGGSYRSKTLFALDEALGWYRGTSAALVEGEIPTSYFFYDFDEFVDYVIRTLSDADRERFDAPVIPRATEEERLRRAEEVVPRGASLTTDSSLRVSTTLVHVNEEVPSRTLALHALKKLRSSMAYLTPDELNDLLTEVSALHAAREMEQHKRLGVPTGITTYGPPESGSPADVVEAWHVSQLAVDRYLNAYRNAKRALNELDKAQAIELENKSDESHLAREYAERQMAAAREEARNAHAAAVDVVDRYRRILEQWREGVDGND